MNKQAAHCRHPSNWIHPLVPIVVSLSLALIFGTWFNKLSREQQRLEHAQKMDADEISRQGVVNAQNASMGSLFFEALSRSDVPLILVGDNGEITGWNRGCEKRFGWSAKELIGRQMSVLIPDGMAKEKEKHDAAFREHRVAKWIAKRVVLDCWIKAKDGSVKRTLIDTFSADHPPTKWLAVLKEPSKIITIPRPTAPQQPIAPIKKG